MMAHVSEQQEQCWQRAAGGLQLTAWLQLNRTAGSVSESIRCPISS